MAESIKAEDIEQSARLVETGRDLLESLKGIHARYLEVRRLTFNEVEYRLCRGDTDGFLEDWEGQLKDIDADLFDDERELKEVEDEVEEVKREHKALLAVHNEFIRIKTILMEGVK